MILTKRELTQRLLNGEKLTPKNYATSCYCCYDETYDYPFRYINIFSENIPMNGSWNETEWEVYQETPEWWEPKDGEKAYYIDVNNSYAESKKWFTEVDKNVIKQGNVFKTREEAEKEVKLRAAKYRVKKRIWELNGGEFVGFEKNLPSCSFILRKGNTKVEAENWFAIKFFPNWQYLKSKEVTKQLIDELYDDLLLIRSE